MVALEYRIVPGLQAQLCRMRAGPESCFIMRSLRRVARNVFAPASLSMVFVGRIPSLTTGIGIARSSEPIFLPQGESWNPYLVISDLLHYMILAVCRRCLISPPASRVYVPLQGPYTTVVPLPVLCRPTCDCHCPYRFVNGITFLC